MTFALLCLGLVARAQEIKTLPRTITVFHYAHRLDLNLPATGPLDSGDPDVQEKAAEYRDRLIGTYQQLDVANANRGFDGKLMGPNGMYVAVDPVASKVWGGRQWTLQALRLPAGTTYFDGRMEVSFSPPQQSVLKSLNCKAQNARDLITRSSKGCMQALRRITQATGCVMIAYWYEFKLLPVCQRVGGRYATAFILIDPAAIDADQVEIFGAPAPTPDPLADDRQNIVDYFAAVGKDSNTFATLSPRADPAPLTAWAQDHLYQCNPNWKE